MKPIRSSLVRRERFALAQLLRRLLAIRKEQLPQPERTARVAQALSEAGSTSRYISIIDEPAHRLAFSVDKEALRARETADNDVSAVA